ncbi:MAG: hypothetical protein K2M54_01425, partial [Muribaculaceae bacterium]|nr:hypothetical protein [Muribaculaceae bacterium]
HDYPGNFVRQQFMPDSLQGHRFWQPCDNQAENVLARRQYDRWYGENENDKKRDNSD